MRLRLVIREKVVASKANINFIVFFIFIVGDFVIVDSSRRHAFESNGGSGKTHYTVLIAINAGGFVLSPFVLYSGQYLIDSWCRGGPDGTFYGVTDKVRLLFQKKRFRFLHYCTFTLILVYFRVG